MGNKFYAVHRGKSPGVYSNWQECKDQVEGFPGARYKSFKTRDEAEEFADTGKTQNKRKKEALPDKDDGVAPRPLPGEMVAYVDGSFHAGTGEFSYGLVAFANDGEIRVSKKVDKPELATMRNVAGEIKGSEAAMRLALEKGCRKITIYHDYEGISKWCLGQWKTNKEGTMAYKKFFDGIKDRLEVEFVKVKGHSNDKYNDLADELAKEAIGIQSIVRGG